MRQIYHQQTLGKYRILLFLTRILWRPCCGLICCSWSIGLPIHPIPSTTLTTTVYLLFSLPSACYSIPHPIPNSFNHPFIKLSFQCCNSFSLFLSLHQFDSARWIAFAEERTSQWKVPFKTHLAFKRLEVAGILLCCSQDLAPCSPSHSCHYCCIGAASRMSLKKHKPWLSSVFLRSLAVFWPG